MDLNFIRNEQPRQLSNGKPILLFVIDVIHHPEKQQMEIANLAPITIVIYANSHLSAIDAAREKVQVLLLDYLDKQDVSDPGAERQLEYEVASSCLGEHRMLGSRNNVVRLGSISQSNTFISLVELTFEFIGGSLAMAPASYKTYP